MSKKTKSDKILDKSIQAVLSAIELYNKPNFAYREESFCILMTNAWELLLKAKILKDNKNNLKTLYIPTSSKTKTDQPRQRFKYKKTRSGNFMTLGISELINREVQDMNLRKHLDILIELRDASVHFYNTSAFLQRQILGIATASLKNYQTTLDEWFGRNLNEFNLSLIPIAFEVPENFDLTLLNQESEEVKKIFAFIENSRCQVEKESVHTITFNIDVKLNRNEGGIRVSYDKEGVPIFQEDEESFKKKYPLDYTTLVEKLKDRYVDFKANTRFHQICTEIKKDEKLFKLRYLDVQNKKGQKKPYYSNNAFKEFDKYYTRKPK